MVTGDTAGSAHGLLRATFHSVRLPERVDADKDVGPSHCHAGHGAEDLPYLSLLWLTARLISWVKPPQRVCRHIEEVSATMLGILFLR